MGRRWWHVRESPSGRRNEGMEPDSPPTLDGSTTHLRDNIGRERCSSATWTLAVDGGQRSPKAPASTKAKTPQGGKRFSSRLTHSPF